MSILESARVIGVDLAFTGEGPGARVGVLSLISADCDTVPSMNRKARDYHLEAAGALAGLGFAVLRPQGPTRTPRRPRPTSGPWRPRARRRWSCTWPTGATPPRPPGVCC